MIKNIFEANVVQELINRISSLRSDSQPSWGKMSVAEMLAHCNVTYEMVYEDKHPKPNAFKRFLLKMFVKNMVVGEKPYKQNSPTASEFIIKDSKNFEEEKQRLVHYIKRTQELGEAHFEGKESHSFGVLDTKEWNNMFYKHLDHHLTQFGV